MTDSNITGNSAVIDTSHGFDWGKALIMRRKQHMSYQAIADKFKVSKQAVCQALEKIAELLPDTYTEIHDDVQTQLKKSLSILLLLDQSDPKRRAEASLNNVSYAQNNIDKQIKLESGQSTEKFNINFELNMLDKRVEEKTLKLTVDDKQDKPGIKDKLKELTEQNTDNRSDIPSPVNPMTTDTIEDAEPVVKK